MRHYEPQWSAEEQTMIDLILLNGCKLDIDITQEYCRIALHHPEYEHPLYFNSDTEYESVRKCFKFWSNSND
jgi:hypothetical protein